jgi:aryl-alcohol dehydrogenase-like predicted oxidoreductase
LTLSLLSHLLILQFQPEALKSNLKILETLQSIADKKGNGCTPAQLALAWCLALSPNVSFLSSLHRFFLHNPLPPLSVT